MRSSYTWLRAALGGRWQPPRASPLCASELGHDRYLRHSDGMVVNRRSGERQHFSSTKELIELVTGHSIRLLGVSGCFALSLTCCAGVY